MTKAFKQGFMDMMQKIASETDRPAGVGLLEDNGIDVDAEPTGPDDIGFPQIDPHPGSYIGRLQRNADQATSGEFWKPHLTVLRSRLANGGSPVVMQSDIDADRGAQSNMNAREFFPVWSAPWRKIQKNLERAGQENQKQYLETGDVVPRGEADMTGLDDIYLTPEQIEMLRNMQNMQVNKGGRSYSSGITA